MAYALWESAGRPTSRPKLAYYPRYIGSFLPDSGPLLRGGNRTGFPNHASQAANPNGDAYGMASIDRYSLYESQYGYGYD